MYTCVSPEGHTNSQCLDHCMHRPKAYHATKFGCDLCQPLTCNEQSLCRDVTHAEVLKLTDHMGPLRHINLTYNTGAAKRSQQVHAQSTSTASSLVS